MKIILSGSSGLVGSALLMSLTTQGHHVYPLVRRAVKNPSEISWDPMFTGPEPARLEGVDAVVHLAGESIASGRWTESRKRAIRDSRAVGTQLLAESLAALKEPPKVFVSASAVGYYGDRGVELLQETSSAGRGFLPGVCQVWEAATRSAQERGIRTIHLRFGIILSARGGALAKMLPPFSMGVGGKIGSGEQYMSWISIDDVVGVIWESLKNEGMRGPVNVVSPRPVRNIDFTRILGRVLHRPTFLPMPAVAARLAFGEMADELLLSSARVEPAVLNHFGYRFAYPDLEGALHHVLRK